MLRYAPTISPGVSAPASTPHGLIWNKSRFGHGEGLTLKRDARQGAVSVKQAGGRVIVQNDPVDTLFGMTRDVIEAGAATDQVPMNNMADLIVKVVGKIQG